MREPIIELTEEMVVGEGKSKKAKVKRRARIARAILSWLFPLRGIAYDTPLHRVIYLSLVKMPKERI